MEVAVGVALRAATVVVGVAAVVEDALMVDALMVADGFNLPAT